MKTDKQLYKIFEANPDWVFQLTGLPSPGKSTLRSVTLKALERMADGVIVPESADQPLTVIEFQFWKDETIYTRTVAEMVAVQEANQMRAVQGIIFFGYNDLDPQTPPWTRVVEAFLLRDVLDAWEREHQGHPLAAVFKPLLVESEKTLEHEAAGYYRTIKHSDLTRACKTSLLEVFVSWLEQRLKHKGKKEIELMLRGPSFVRCSQPNCEL
jgi:predicted ATPase